MSVLQWVGEWTFGWRIRSRAAIRGQPQMPASIAAAPMSRSRAPMLKTCARGSDLGIENMSPRNARRAWETGAELTNPSWTAGFPVAISAARDEAISPAVAAVAGRVYA